MISFRLIAASALAISGMCGIASAQGLPQGRVYAFHSGPQAGCPGLDWHIVANGSALDGMLGWDNMKAMARATGTMNLDAKTFQMTAKEVGGQERTATISGSVQSDGYLNANITGPNVSCKNVTVRWFVATPGGGGGN
jgi:hypothetical protein